MPFLLPYEHWWVRADMTLYLWVWIKTKNDKHSEKTPYFVRHSDKQARIFFSHKRRLNFKHPMKLNNSLDRKVIYLSFPVQFFKKLLPTMQVERDTPVLNLIPEAHSFAFRCRTPLGSYVLFHMLGKKLFHLIFYLCIWEINHSFPSKNPVYTLHHLLTYEKEMLGYMQVSRNCSDAPREKSSGICRRLKTRREKQAEILGGDPQSTCCSVTHRRSRSEDAPVSVPGAERDSAEPEPEPERVSSEWITKYSHRPWLVPALSQTKQHRLPTLQLLRTLPRIILTVVLY